MEHSIPKHIHLNVFDAGFWELSREHCMELKNLVKQNSIEKPNQADPEKYSRPNEWFEVWKCHSFLSPFPKMFAMPSAAPKRIGTGPNVDRNVDQTPAATISFRKDLPDGLEQTVHPAASVEPKITIEIPSKTILRPFENTQEFRARVRAPQCGEIRSF
jgi:hypothetical protein